MTSAIATFEPRERALSPSEVRSVLAALDHVLAAPTLRLAVKFVLMTGVRKSQRERLLGGQTPLG